MNFGSTLKTGLRTRPYFPPVRDALNFLKQESRLYKLLFAVLLFPLAIPLLDIAVFLIFPTGDGGVEFANFLKVMSFEISVDLAIVLYCILAVLEKRWRPFLRATQLWIFNLGAILTLTSVFSPDRAAAFFGAPSRADGVVMLAHVAAYIFILSWILRTRPRWESFSVVAVLFACAAAAGAFILYFTREHLGMSLSLRSATQIIFGNTGFFAHYLLLALALNLFFVFTKPRAFNIIFVPAMIFPALIATQSTVGVFLAVALYVPIYWIVARRFVYGGAFLVLFLGWFALATNSRLLDPLLNIQESLVIRFQVWKEAIGAVLRGRPFLGYGWGNAELVWNNLPKDSWQVSGTPDSPLFFDKAHNIAVEFLIAAGPLGAAAFFAFFARIGALIWRKLRQSKDMVARWFAVVFAVNLIYLVFNFDMLMSYVLFGIVLAGFILRERDIIFKARPALRRTGFFLLSAGAFAAAAIFLYLNAAAFSSAYLIGKARGVHTAAARGGKPSPEETLNYLAEAGRIKHPYDLLGLEKIPVLKYLLSDVSMEEQTFNRAQAELRKIYRDLQTAHPLNATYFHNQAADEQQLFKNLSASEQALKEAVRIAPGKGLYRLQLALIYLLSDNPKAARPILDELYEEEQFERQTELYLAFADFLEGNAPSAVRRVIKVAGGYRITAEEWQAISAAYLTQAPVEALLAQYERLFPLGYAPDQGLYAAAAQLARLLGNEKLAQSYDERYRIHLRTGLMRRAQ